MPRGSTGRSLTWVPSRLDPRNGTDWRRVHAPTPLTLLAAPSLCWGGRDSCADY